MEEIGKDAIAQLHEVIDNIETAVTDTATLEQSLKAIDALRESMQCLEKKIKEQIYARVPESVREEVRLAWEDSGVKYAVKTNIPITIHIHRGGEDWVNIWTDHPYFMDDMIENVPIPEHAREEICAYERLLSKKLRRFNDLRWDVKKEYGVDAFDVIDENEV